MAEEHWPYRRIKRPPRMQVWLDGRFLFEEDPIFSLSDWNSAQQMGFSVLFRAYGSEIRFFNRYYEHLVDCLTLSQFPDFIFLSRDMLRSSANTLLQKNRYHRNALLNATCFLRLHPDWSNSPQWTTSLLLQAEQLEGQYFDSHIPASVVISYQDIRLHADKLSSIAWLGNPNLGFARQFCEQRGATDCLLYNEAGVPLQTSQRDIYCWKGDTVFTPALELGLRHDPFREIVAEAVRQKGCRIEEGKLTWKIFQQADEIFLASTRYGIEPVKRLDNKITSETSKRTRELIETLNKLFFAELQ